MRVPDLHVLVGRIEAAARLQPTSHQQNEMSMQAAAAALQAEAAAARRRVGQPRQASEGKLETGPEAGRSGRLPEAPGEGRPSAGRSRRPGAPGGHVDLRA